MALSKSTTVSSIGEKYTHGSPELGPSVLAEIFMKKRSTIGNYSCKDLGPDLNTANSSFEQISTREVFGKERSVRSLVTTDFFLIGGGS